MAVDFSRVVVDDREVKAALRSLGARLTPAQMRSVLRAAGVPINRASKAAAPRRTGTLAASHRISTKATRARVVAKVGPKAPHAHLVELGTKPHLIRSRRFGSGRRRRWIHPGAKPKPFLLPAFEAHKDEAIAIVRAKLYALIAKARGEKPRNALGQFI